MMRDSTTVMAVHMIMYSRSNTQEMYSTSMLRKCVPPPVDPVMVGVGGGSPGWLMFSCMEGAGEAGWTEFFFFKTMKTIASAVRMTAGPSVMMVWKAE